MTGIIICLVLTRKLLNKPIYTKVSNKTALLISLITQCPTDAHPFPPFSIVIAHTTAPFSSAAHITPPKQFYMKQLHKDTSKKRNNNHSSFNGTFIQDNPSKPVPESR